MKSSHLLASAVHKSSFLQSLLQEPCSFGVSVSDNRLRLSQKGSLGSETRIEILFLRAVLSTHDLLALPDQAGSLGAQMASLP